MTSCQIVPIVHVADIRSAEAFYCSLLGFHKDWEYAASTSGPFYLGLSFGGSRLHLSSFPGDGRSGTAVYFYVDDVDRLFATFQQAGLKEVEFPPTDQPWGQREFYVLDPDGNCLRFGAAIR